MSPGRRSAGATNISSGQLVIKTAHGAVLLGRVFSFPKPVQAAARYDGPMPALAKLREHRGSAAMIRRWALANGEALAINSPLKPRLLEQVRRAVTENRLLLVYVPDLPRPVHVQLTQAAAPRVPFLPTGTGLTPQQQADAKVTAMDAVDRVLDALGRCGKHMGPTLGNAFASLFTVDTAKMLAIFFIAGAAANTNPVTAAVFDTAMIGFAWYIAGTTGIEALGTLFTATVAASGAASEADLEAAAKGYAEGFIGLGGAVFMAWLAKRMSRPKARGGVENAGEAPVEQAARRQRVREEPAKAAELAASRPTTAANFYARTGWSDAKIADHLKGIDFAKPVDVVTLPKGTTVIQYQIPGRPIGSYFAPPGTAAESLGINPVGRVVRTFTLESDVTVLRSTSATIPDWAGSGAIFEGGGTQYFAADNAAFAGARK